MDTSETYIKMRLAAIPDLGRGILPIGSLWKEKHTDKYWILVFRVNSKNGYLVQWNNSGLPSW